MCRCGGLVMSIFYIFVWFMAKYGTEINEIYCYNKCSGGGLEITKYAKI